MNLFLRIPKAIRYLGYDSLFQYFKYRLILKSGWLDFSSHRALDQAGGGRTYTWQELIPTVPVKELLEVIGQEGLESTIREASEICAGQYRQFGDSLAPLDLVPPGQLDWFTEYEKSGKKTWESDIKFIWEPARFGWVYPLARAYAFTQDEEFSVAFWKLFEQFQSANPPYKGPNWISGQEVALRLIAFTYAGQIFFRSQYSTQARKGQLSQAVAAHAFRIPLTLSYARAQNNNHLLSEAVGLYTAAFALPNHPQSRSWEKLGWYWFNSGIRSQITASGTYIQHSTNYLRLVLQLSLWFYRIVEHKGCSLPELSRSRLAAATQWLHGITDGQSGSVPNLGPNDGAYIQPYSVCPFQDYRPVLQAAGLAFVGKLLLPEGIWDDMGLWYGLGNTRTKSDLAKPNRNSKEKQIFSGFEHENDHNGIILDDAGAHLHLSNQRSWAYLRAVRFTSRPGHADQLHLDLWWEGMNIARDAGTYLYNAAPPWDNSLASTAVHNTVIIDGKDQMTRVGKFLWLDWVQAEVVSQAVAGDLSWQRVTAELNLAGKHRLIHRRMVTQYQANRWVVEDTILSSKKNKTPFLHEMCLHWLLPDWEYRLSVEKAKLLIELLSPIGTATLMIRIEPVLVDTPVRFLLARGGHRVAGEGQVEPTWGWYSPTYNRKQPALSLRVYTIAEPPLTLHTEWKFPE